MRLVVLAVAGVALGGLGGWAVATLAPPPSQIFQAARGVGGDLAKLSIGDLLPIRKTYDKVIAEITSGKNTLPDEFRSSPIETSFPNLNSQNLNLGLGLNNGASPWKWQGVNQTPQMGGHGRNPAAANGPPPH